MKNIAKRILSFTLSALMMASAVSVTASASAKKDPKDIDKYIVDMRNEKSFSQNAEYYEHTPSAGEPDPFTGGKYHFDAEKEAMQIEYYETGAQVPIHLMLKVNRFGKLSMEYKYMVMVYSVKASAPYRLSVWNSPRFGKEALIVDNGSDTEGKFVVSKPVDVSLADDNGRSILKRWCDKSINTINLKTDDKAAELYVKEIGFFKTEADANAYYASVDLSKPASTYANEDALDTIIRSNPVEVLDDVQTEAPAPGKNLPAPVIMSFEGEDAFSANAKQLKHIDNGWNEKTESFVAHKFVTLPDGQKCLQLIYESDIGGYKGYRTMPSFASKNVITSDHKYVRITYMTDDKLISTISLKNNGTGESVTLSENTLTSGGKFVTTNPVRIPDAFVTRYANGIHCTIAFNSTSASSNFYIKEMGFFASEDQAYEYYGDSFTMETVAYTAMVFGEAGNGALTSGDTYGNAVINNDTGTVDIAYAKTTNMGFNYMAKIKFDAKNIVTPQDSYIRVLYSAKNPEGVNNASMLLRNDKYSAELIRIVKDIPNTNGEYVLSPTVRLAENMRSRYSTEGNHNSLLIDTAAEGGEYKIKAIYFFKSRAAADSFEVTEGKVNISVNGNDISKYQVVINSEPTTRVTEAAEAFVQQVKVLTGIELPIVSDTAAETEYEVLIGASARAQSEKLPAGVNQNAGDAYKNIWMFVDANDLIFGAELAPAVKEVVDSFLASYLYKGIAGAPAAIDIDSSDLLIGKSTVFKFYELYEKPVNSANPEHVTVDFTTDEGYFNEENGEENWAYVDGALKTEAKGYALSYIHVFEKNVTYKAKLSYNDPAADASMGLMLRYNHAKAWVKAGYDFAKGVWYIESRDGQDFYAERCAEATGAVTPGTVYSLEFKVDGEYASLSVNGESLIDKAKVNHFTPGRVGVYAENVTAILDDVDVALVSGQGTVWKNVEHTRLDTDYYIEGGTVTEMTNGDLVYLHQSGTTFRSIDNGKNWTREDRWTTTTGYVNIIRLNNGDLMKMTKIGNEWFSQTSSDDGKTWVTGGKFCNAYWEGTTAGAGNMNDKIMQCSENSPYYPNRIFYGQNYESTTMLDNGRRVFCEFYYSDDNGATWTKSETDSWEIEGNEKTALFGECKLLECADGTIRMYNSWSTDKNIVYADSKDGGKTFGPLMQLEGYYTPHSSMQFVRDPWGETPTTYYMVWVDNHEVDQKGIGTRAALSLAKSTDGKNWTDLGDVWRWESTYTVGMPINHIVDPFIKVTKDYILCGSGFSDGLHISGEGGHEGHQSQRQHIYSIPKVSVDPGEKLYNFTDVTTKDAYYESVKYAVDNGLFNGTSDTTFSPASPMTRAMFVTVLGRLAKADVAAYATPTFNDVIAGQWYTSYVEWAAANGIVNGLGSGIYGINDNVTIQQACVILARYADYNVASAQSGKTAADFADGASVASWATKEVDWAIANGIYVGSGANLNPTSPASRATVATMFANYVKAYGA